MAIETEKAGKVIHVPQMTSFMVEGLTGQKYAVSLFPKESCQCPSSTTCYHILAAKLSVNLPIEGMKKQHYLTILRRNARCRSANKLGRKHQTVDNTSATPSPDSRAATKRMTGTSKQENTSKNAKLEEFEAEFESIPEDNEDEEEEEDHMDHSKSKPRKSLEVQDEPNIKRLSNAAENRHK